MIYHTNSLFPRMRTLIPDFEDGMSLLRRDLDGVLQKPSGMMAGFPDIDCYSEADNLVFQAELPGFGADDVEIDVHENTLTLRGAKKAAQRQEDADVHFTEIRHGSFERKFTLPENVNTDDVNAVFRNGVLSIRLPLVPESRPKKVRILTDKD